MCLHGDLSYLLPDHTFVLRKLVHITKGSYAMAVSSPVHPSPKKPNTPIITIDPVDTSSATTTSSSVKSNPIYPSPRKPRFAEATSVYSPIEASFTSNNPFATYHAQAQPADVGLDYAPSMGVEVPITPFSPLRSAMRLPNEQVKPGGGMLSPTFREERLLEKREESTEKEQAKDLVCVTTWVLKPSISLTTATRKSKSASASPRSSSEAQTSPAHSSSSPCSARPFPSSTRPRTYQHVTTFHLGRQRPRSGRR